MNFDTFDNLKIETRSNFGLGPYFSKHKTDEILGFWLKMQKIIRTCFMRNS